LEQHSSSRNPNGEKVISHINLALTARRKRKAMDDYPCVQPDRAHKDAYEAYNAIVKHAQREVRAAIIAE
jgi:hypothetical protein